MSFSRNRYDQSKRERSVSPQRHRSYANRIRKTRPSGENDDERDAPRVRESREKAFLKQQKLLKAIIRVKEDRAGLFEKLLVSLSLLSQQNNQGGIYNGSMDLTGLDMFDPIFTIKVAAVEDINILLESIPEILTLTDDTTSLSFWKSVSQLAVSFLELDQHGNASRSLKTVAEDIQNILAPKNFEQLVKLETQVQGKLQSREPIDTDYWEDLLKSIQAYKAMAYLRDLFSQPLEQRKQKMVQHEMEKAISDANFLRKHQNDTPTTKLYQLPIDPDPLYQIDTISKTAEPIEQRDYEDSLSEKIEAIKGSIYIPTSFLIKKQSKQPQKNLISDTEEDFFNTVSAKLEREYLKAGGEEEQEMFGDFVEGQVKAKSQDGIQLKKPKYFNKVMLGFEWNSYNQAHYNEAHPPPKAVQGYRFNIFYPDLIGTTRSPTYKIERGPRADRESAMTQDNVCIIRFIAGVPYQDIAFCIVDKEWDYSAKRERGFKSSFDNGVLSLHFQFKKTHHKR
ncbi:cactin, spliceosome complex subunit [Schizosaccharomyces osmophilus]|uniref:Splicing factor Cactin n=1 Tax=Schizosaccharomyces osmophilus TaxID=2545709 RepID=A0AAE9WDA2_9SCHI|nr:cactin, spliceosome complex subunit [Schizosaccharomyces osmophilus]WBW73062.1 cactin, spliceosome complex subunit [Schizosaccharomyces osmophilus]